MLFTAIIIIINEWMNEFFFMFIKIFGKIYVSICK